MLAHLVAQIARPPGQLRISLIIAFVIAIASLIWCMTIYVRRRRTQIGTWGALLGMTVWCAAIVFGLLLLTAISIQGRTLRPLLIYLSVVAGLMLAIRLVDYVRFRLSLPDKRDILIVFGKGRPFLNNIQGIGQLIGSMALFGTTLIRPLIRLLRQPDNVILSLIGMLAAWIILSILLNRRTPWFASSQSISIWGREPIDWSEVVSYSWASSGAQSKSILTLRLEGNESIIAPIEYHREELEQLLIHHVEPTAIRPSGETDRGPSVDSTVDPSTLLPIETIRYQYTKKHFREAMKRLTRRNSFSRSIRAGIVLAVGFAVGCGLLSLAIGRIPFGPNVALFVVIAGMTLAFLAGLIIRPMLGRFAAVLSAQSYDHLPSVRSIQTISVLSSGLVVQNKQRGSTHVPWSDIRRLERDSDWLDVIGRSRTGSAAGVNWLSIHRDMVKEGDLDRFANAASSYAAVEYV